MSRRPTPGQAAQNSQTIKALLKLEHNKICADCKRNKREWSPIPSWSCAHAGFISGAISWRSYTELCFKQTRDGLPGT